MNQCTLVSYKVLLFSPAVPAIGVKTAYEKSEVRHIYMVTINWLIKDMSPIP